MLMYSNIPLLRIILPQLLFRRPGMWAESAKTLSLQKGKEKNMEEILKIDTVDQYNKLFGFETRHPQVGVVSFDTAESQGNYRMTMGFYSVFLKETAGCRINYGKTSYDFDDQTVICIAPGQTVGILGGTGSAKSTLVQLIPRLYDATSGTVMVGGYDVKEYDLYALREAIGIVLQKNVLFSGTVRENLLWGNPNADDEMLWEVCRMACAEEFLERMPMGLDTDLGQGGVNLSGGQKQRLCIARTLLKKPKVLIFDDSTSAVDTATEQEIRTALSRLDHVTKIIIAQRLTSDQIVVMDDGEIHAVGTHASLLAHDKIYQEIYASQVKGGQSDAGTTTHRQEA